MLKTAKVHKEDKKGKYFPHFPLTWPAEKSTHIAMKIYLYMV